MSTRLARYVLLAGALVAALAVAQPTLAYTELKVTGTTGAHSLVDGAGNPGVICTTKYSATYDAFKLKHMYVNPPKMKAVPSQGHEKVGWQFTI